MEPVICIVQSCMAPSGSGTQRLECFGRCVMKMYSLSKLEFKCGGNHP